MSSETLIGIVGIVAFLSIGAFSALKPRMFARRIHARAWRQPIPNVTQEDVKRVIRRDFYDSQFNEVEGILKQCADPWGGNVSRIQLAALKLADGNLEQLQKFTDLSKVDFRDIITAAEYPGYLKADASLHRFSNKQRQEIIDADWAQYRSWLQR